MTHTIHDYCQERCSICSLSPSLSLLLYIQCLPTSANYVTKHSPISKPWLCMNSSTKYPDIAVKFVQKASPANSNWKPISGHTNPRVSNPSPPVPLSPVVRHGVVLGLVRLWKTLVVPWAEVALAMEDHARACHILGQGQSGNRWRRKKRARPNTSQGLESCKLSLRANSHSNFVWGEFCSFKWLSLPIYLL